MTLPRACFAALLVACGGNAAISETTVEREDPAATVVEPAVATPEPEPDPEPEPEPEPMRVVASERSPLSGSPTVRLRSPRNDAVVRRGPVMLDVDVSDFALGEAPEGAHLHVRVDESREMAVYDVSRPIDLRALHQEATGQPLAAGSMVLRLFLARGDHESVKRKEAMVTRLIHVGARSRDHRFDARAPWLVPSRPQGCSSSSTRLLDFQLENIEELSEEGYRVTYEIDGEFAGTITRWVPHRIENLERGEHQIVMTLQGADGETVGSNHYVRSFTSDDDCPSYAVNAYEPRPSEDDDGSEEDEPGL